MVIIKHETKTTPSGGEGGTFVRATEAERRCGIGRRTLFKWAKEGHLKYIRPNGKGHWLLDISSITTRPSAAATKEQGVIKAIYARVSTRKQLPDLQTQIETLQAKYPDHIVFSDCASGLNFKRKGLQALLQLAFEGRLLVVRIANRDRLCRFAYDLIEFVLRKHRAKISVESDDARTPSIERELAEDVISVVTVFGARLYGARSGAGRKAKQVSEVEAASVTTTESGGDRGTNEAQALPEKAAALAWADSDLQGVDVANIGTEGGAEAVFCGVAPSVQPRKRMRKVGSKKDIFQCSERMEASGDCIERLEKPD